MQAEERRKLWYCLHGRDFFGHCKLMKIIMPLWGSLLSKSPWLPPLFGRSQSQSLVPALSHGGPVTDLSMRVSTSVPQTTQADDRLVLVLMDGSGGTTCQHAHGNVQPDLTRCSASMSSVYRLPAWVWGHPFYPCLWISVVSKIQLSGNSCVHEELCWGAALPFFKHFLFFSLQWLSRHKITLSTVIYLSYTVILPHLK